MPIKYFEPVTFKTLYYHAIEKQVEAIFDEWFYIPLSKALKTEVLNSAALSEDIRSGRIYYSDGVFYGQFSASISKELKKLGATWNRMHKGFTLPRTLMPLELSQAINAAEANYREMLNNVNKMLDEVEGKLNDFEGHKQKIEQEYERTIGLMDSQFLRTVKSMGIVPSFTTAQRKIIAKEWTNNLELYIKKWSKENVVSLRKKIQKNTLSGQRSSALIPTIEQNYKTSRAKARFLARQETSMLLSKMRELRYLDAGIPEYTWSTSNDAKVRPEDKANWQNPNCNNHRILEGTVQRWAAPPVVDGATGRRCHPGEDYGCRCVAIAFLRF